MFVPSFIEIPIASCEIYVLTNGGTTDEHHGRLDRMDRMPENIMPLIGGGGGIKRRK